MAVRTLIVVGLLAATAACSNGDGDATPRATLLTAAPTTTAASATTTPSTAAPTSTTAPVTSTTTEGELTPELEAEIVDVYRRGSAVLYEALSNPANADPSRLDTYWAPSLAAAWRMTIADWAQDRQRAEPGPRALHHQDAVSVDLMTPERASLTTCNVSDVAVFDEANDRYLDPGVLGSGTHRVDLRRVDGRWLIYSDEEIEHFGEQVGCDE